MNQLQRYRTIINGNFPLYQPVFLFLTPDGEPPSNEAYLPLSYGTIVEVLEAVKAEYFHKHKFMDAAIDATISHYIEMLRRHIVSDSEIAQLCRQIYHKHKRALDLIFEHRPDLYQEVSEYLRGLLDDQEWVVLGPWVRSAMYFIPFQWNENPVLKMGHEWHGSGYLFRFRFVYGNNSLMLRIIINSGSNYLLAKVLDVLKGFPIFKGVNKAVVSPRSIYTRRILPIGQFDDATLDDLKPKINEFWRRFLDHDLPEIRRVIENEIPWHALEQ